MSAVHSPPFQPPVFVDQLIKGGWNWHQPPAGFVGPFQYAGQSRTFAPYSGMEQTAAINMAYPKPPKSFSPSAAPPSISQIK